jgi:hypothetical protein
MWKINSYIWAFCAAGWAWITFVSGSPEALVVTIGCGAVAALAVSRANDDN